MTDEEVRDLFLPLQADLTNMATVAGRPTYLAHYTSLDVLEKIMQHNELWFSHPFFMNDLQEMRFGIVEGFKIFDEYSRSHEFLTACGTPERARLLVTFFGSCCVGFDLKHALNVYVLCFSAHNDPADSDGLLSMWRGYGAHGNGAALIFKTDFLKQRAKSPLFAGKVFYASDEGRKHWLADMFRAGLDILKFASISDDKLHVVAISFFDVMKIFALLSKHKGFDEEKEWRIIYLPDRDELNLLTSRISYSIGKRGIEPKLKCKLEPLKFKDPETWTFDSILHQIILGPSLSAPLTSGAVCKMFAEHNKSHFIGRMHASGIPLRPLAG